VTFDDGTTVVADAEHQWETHTRASRRVAGPAGVRTTQDIFESVRGTTADRRANHSVVTAEPLSLPDADVLVDPYVLGVWLGGGTSTKAEVTCGPGDEQILEEMRAAGHDVREATGRLAYRIGGLSRGRVGRRRDSGGRYSADGSLSSALRALGVLGNKHIPDEYMRGSVEQRTALLRGGAGERNDVGALEHGAKIRTISQCSELHYVAEMGPVRVEDVVVPVRLEKTSVSFEVAKVGGDAISAIEYSEEVR